MDTTWILSYGYYLRDPINRAPGVADHDHQLAINDFDRVGILAEEALNAHSEAPA